MTAQKITISVLNRALDDYQQSGQKFNAASLLKTFKVRPAKALTEKIEQTILNDERFFGNEDYSEFVSKKHFFEGRYLVLTPDDREIEDGILFPGHRFAPFCSHEVFPSEVTLRCEKSKKNFALKEIQDELPRIFPYHLLLGSEQISDFLQAEHADNQSLAQMNTHQHQVKLNVFDFKEFYQKHDFASGDALLVKICDFDRGIFAVQYLDGKKRANRAIEEFCHDFTEAVKSVIARFENYLDMPEQLAWAFYLADRDLLIPEAASMDEFIKNTSEIQIGFDSGHTFLALADQNALDDSGHDDADDGHCCTGHNHEDFGGLPEGISVSRGELGSLEQLLKTVGSFLTLDETDAYLLDNCFLRDLDFDCFLNRAFKLENLHFADEAQRLVFLNALEEHFEELSGNYNRYEDETKADLRKQILEIVESRVEFLENLKSFDLDTKQAPAAPMHQIAESALYLNNLLHLLNAPEHIVSEKQAGDLAESIGNMADLQADAIDAVNRALNI